MANLLNFKITDLFFSKWFYYVIIAIFLAILYDFVWNAAFSYNNDFALRFNPTMLGIIINFAIFIVFFDVREYLELKINEKPVKERIGRQLHGLFEDIIDLCEVHQELDDFGKPLEIFHEKALNLLATSKEIKLKDGWKDKDTSLYLAKRFNSQWEALSRIAERHEKLLNSNVELRDSLMNLEDAIHTLSFELSAYDFNEKDREHFIIRDVTCIVKKIYEMRKKGMNVNF